MSRSHQIPSRIDRVPYLSINTYALDKTPHLSHPSRRFQGHMWRLEASILRQAHIIVYTPNRSSLCILPDFCGSHLKHLELETIYG